MQTTSQTNKGPVPEVTLGTSNQLRKSLSPLERMKAILELKVTCPNSLSLEHGNKILQKRKSHKHTAPARVYPSLGRTGKDKTKAGLRKGQRVGRTGEWGAGAGLSGRSSGL